MYMARSDSIMIGLLAVAQLMLWQYLQDRGVEAVAEIFGVTGGTTALLAIYFLTSVGKYHKDNWYAPPACSVDNRSVVNPLNAPLVISVQASLLQF